MKLRLVYVIVIAALALAACGGAAETPATTETQAPAAADQSTASGDTTAATGDTAAATGDTAAATGDKPGGTTDTTTTTTTGTGGDTSASAGTVATAAPSCPQYYTETFDSDTCWAINTPLVVTTPSLNQITIGLHNGALRFRINTNETYAYVFYGGAQYGDVAISADVVSTMNNSHGIVLACDVTDRGWYEARISTGGTYAVYSYTQALKDAHENPYYDYANSVTNTIIPGINHLNRVGIACIGDTFTLVVNGQIVWSDTIPGMQSGGLVGVGAVSNVNFPVEIDFDNITIEQP